MLRVMGRRLAPSCVWAMAAALHFCLFDRVFAVSAQEPPTAPRTETTAPRAEAPAVKPAEVLFGTEAFDPAIPAPQSVTGHALGDGILRWEQVIAYFKTLDEASDRVAMSPYGQTHEGRDLYLLVVTSEANQERLDDLREKNGRLADPRKLADPDEAKAILETAPGVAWLAYSIHGDETSGTDASLQVAYALAAGRTPLFEKLREGLIVIIDPSQNPDGRERYLSQLQQLGGRVQNQDYQSLHHEGFWSAGRGNHYLFDLNRDWLTQTQPETRGRAAAYLRWNPQLLIDSHEMEPTETFLLDPPREPWSPHLSPKVLAWRRIFGLDQAHAFDEEGWSYYTREWYEEWYPGYTNSWASLGGAIGLLYEQAGVDGTAVKQATGDLLTYREAVEHQAVSSIANLQSLLAHRADILREFYEDRADAVSGRHAGAYLFPPSSDRALEQEFIDVLLRQGIEVERAAEAVPGSKLTGWDGVSEEPIELPRGTLVVREGQPRRRLIHALLEFDPRMSDSAVLEERQDLERGKGSRVYDVTAWNLSMSFGMTAWWIDAMPKVQTAALKSTRQRQTTAPLAATPDPADHRTATADQADKASAPLSYTYGYLVRGDSSALYPALVELFNRGCKVRLAEKPFTLENPAAATDLSFPRGSLLLRAGENPPGVERILREVQIQFPIDVDRTWTARAKEGPDLGGARFILLTPPKAALVGQWPFSPMSFGGVWHELDHETGLTTSLLNGQTLGDVDLRRYNVLILPEGGSSAVLTPDVLENLDEWVRAGGTLIAIGESAARLCDKEHGIAGTRLRQDVLEDLEKYAEAAARERAALRVKVDYDGLWRKPALSRTPTAEGDETKSESKSENGSAEADSKAAANSPSTQASIAADADGKKNEAVKAESSSLPEPDKRSEWDERLRLFHPFGAFARAEVDPEHWLTCGLPFELPVLIDGENAFMSKEPVVTPLRLSPADRLRLSGLLWPEALQRWADAAWATVESHGNGQIILFSYDPVFRGYTEGTRRLFLNAVFFGPGAGTNPPLPW